MESGLAAQAIAGTHTVLLGIELDDRVGCLGFAIHRTDHTEDEAYWLRGMKSFASVVPNPVAGESYSMRDQPLQGFQWATTPRSLSTTTHTEPSRSADRPAP